MWIRNVLNYFRLTDVISDDAVARWDLHKLNNISSFKGYAQATYLKHIHTHKHFNFALEQIFIILF